MPTQVSVCKAITVINKPEEKSIDTTICYGNSWFAEGKWQTAPGTYHDTIHFSAGCDSIIVTALNFTSKIPVNLGRDTTVCNGIPLLLRTGVPGAKYLWQDGSADSTLLISQAGHYWVVVTRQGCSARDSIVITGCTSPVWFPNAFTPNRDGINDTFHPIGSGVSEFSMNIFNRWGEQVFKTADFREGWDGRFRGSDASDGIYYYVATFKMFDNQGETYHAHGSVTLLK